MQLKFEADVIRFDEAPKAYEMFDKKEDVTKVVFNP